jgi:hypothetical protein
LLLAIPGDNDEFIKSVLYQGIKSPFQKASFSYFEKTFGRRIGQRA